MSPPTPPGGATGSIVSNTGPLIALATVDSLALLKDLFSEVGIPPEVHRELLAKTGPEAPRLAKALDDYVRVMPQPSFPEELGRLLRGLGAGESQAIGIASQKA